MPNLAWQIATQGRSKRRNERRTSKKSSASSKGDWLSIQLPSIRALPCMRWTKAEKLFGAALQEVSATALTTSAIAYSLQSCTCWRCRIDPTAPSSACSSCKKLEPCGWTMRIVPRHLPDLPPSKNKIHPQNIHRCAQDGRCICQHLREVLSQPRPSPKAHDTLTQHKDLSIRLASSLRPR